MIVSKSLNLYRGGRFTSSASGESFVLTMEHSSSLPPHKLRCTHASASDLQACLGDAETGFRLWKEQDPFLRAQTLYHMAEIASGRQKDLEEALHRSQDGKQNKAEAKELIASLLYYAGFADKYQQLLGSINPVRSPYACQSCPEAVGTVVILGPLAGDPSGLSDTVWAALAAGNSVTMIPGEQDLPVAAILAECADTAALPPGVLNFLSTRNAYLDQAVASSQRVRTVWISGEEEQRLSRIRYTGATDLKRVESGRQLRSLKKIIAFTDIKTIWEPQLN
ncbi:MAG: aldehyde dehydrogenase family protein [Deltaproteobacteria bacterium]|nr:aldehyde dehydrogenase family protein [Deltaproteobacteria bacterium]